MKVTQAGWRYYMPWFYRPEFAPDLAEGKDDYSMITFIVRRLFIAVVLVFLISIISFFIVVRTPGGPGSFADMNPTITKSVRENFRKQFHLDEPIWKQYWFNMSGLFTGELRSIMDGRPVLERIGERLPATLALNIASIILSLSFGLLIGVYSCRS